MSRSLDAARGFLYAHAALETAIRGFASSVPRAEDASALRDLAAQLTEFRMAYEDALCVAAVSAVDGSNRLMGLKLKALTDRRERAAARVKELAPVFARCIAERQS